MKLLKILFLIILISIISAAGYIYANRKSLFDYNINKLTKSLLPAYIEIADLNFDMQNRRISIKDLKIRNPAGFVHDYLAEIPQAECIYTQKDNQNILKGVHIKDIDLTGPSIFIVRQEDLSINVQNMDEVFKEAKPARSEPSIISKAMAYLFYLFSPVKKIDELVEIDPVFNIKDGRFIFDDYSFSQKGYRSTIDNITADIDLTLRKDLKGIDYIKSKGRGIVNGGKSQAVDWVTEYNPTRPKLTMANTLKISGIDFLHFKPYYDQFSPFIFKGGRASGDLIFNFDNGEIGSTNEVRFSSLELEAKENFNYKDFWDANVDDLYRYFSSPGGEIVFDFKIKGPMEKPKFYLGSKSKRALTKMVMYKITDSLFKKDKEAQPGSEAPQAETPTQEKSEVEQIMDIFKSIKKSYDSKE